jgi:flagellar hook-associated protein 2
MSIGPLGPVSFQGIVSGLNVTSIIQKLMAVNQLPLQEITQQESTVTQQETAWSGVQSALQSFLNSVQALDTSLFQSVSATSSNPSVLTASATNGAVAASYAISVTSLAQPEIDASTGFASSTTSLGFSGSFTVNGQTVNVSTTDSLSTIAANINAANAGVTATVINTGAATNPYELWITSNGTGTANAITYADTSGTPLQSLGILNTSNAKNVVQAAQNASFTVNGASFSSSSNTVTGALPDISLTLLAPGSATVTVGADTAAMQSAVQSFVSAYNGLVSTFQQDLAPSGPLAGNASLQTIWNDLAQALFTTVPTGTSVQSLADVGVTFVPTVIGSASNGTLQVNSTTLASALANNLQGVAQLFTATGGLGSLLTGLVQPMSQPGGIIAQVQNDLQQEMTQLQNEQSQLQQQLTQEQNLLEQEFNNMETVISHYQSEGQLLGYFGAGLLGGGTSAAISSSSSGTSSGSGLP